MVIYKCSKDSLSAVADMTEPYRSCESTSFKIKAREDVTMSKLKTKTMKLEVGANKEITVWVQNAPVYEDGNSLAQLFEGVIQGGIKLGQKIDAWKFYDTCSSYRFVKKDNDYRLYFQSC